MRILELKSVQCQSIKSLFESLKELLDDCNIKFDETGMRILAIDGSHVCLVHMKLMAEKFVKYECSRPITVGVNIASLHKLLKSISSDDTLTISIDDDNLAEMSIRIENAKKNYVAINEYKLLDIDDKDFTVPDVEFTSVITMPSADFQTLCRDMCSISEDIEIQSVGNQLTISADGDFASKKVILGPTEKGLAFYQNSTKQEVIHGTFSLRFLLLFTKATPLSNSIQIFLKNDFPMIIQYTIANLGQLKFALSPKVDNH